MEKKAKNAYTGIVFRKEMLDMFRDRKTIITSLMLPLVLYPLMFFFMGLAFGDLFGEETLRRASLTGDPAAQAQASALLSGAEGLELVETPDPMAALEDETVSAVLKCETTDDGKLFIRVVYDDKKNESSINAQMIIQILSEVNQAAVQAKLTELGIDPDALSPLVLETRTVAEEQGTADSGSAGMMIGMLLPMLLVVLLSVGGMATASDLFAGEKERKTMEPLLCTRAGRSTILSGKFLAVTVFSLISVAATAAGMVLAYVLSPDFFTIGGQEEVGGLQLPLPAILTTLVLVAIMAMLFSGLHSVISTYARTSKEAASYGSFLMLVSYIPAFATMMMGAGDIKRWMMLVPVMNVIGSLKMLLGGITDYVFLGGSAAVSAVFLLLVLGLAGWLFGKETIMLRTT